MKENLLGHNFMFHPWLKWVMPHEMKFWHGLAAVAVLLSAVCPPAFSWTVPEASRPALMKRPPASTNSVRWHSIAVTPATNHAKIHFYNKLNPGWWFGNVDDPVPPPWYRTNSQHRIFLWHLRNPFHNFDHYVIGVADKKFVRSGRWPERNSNPYGGWDLEVARRKLAVLPFLSCERGRFNFYFGWRESGSFGLKLNF